MAKRVANEFAATQKIAAKEGWFKLETYGDNLNEWKVIMNGPENSPYEGGKFEIKITLPADYPHKPPVFKVITKIYSALINPDDQSICHPLLDINGNDNCWKPTNKVSEIILSFRTMLADLTCDHIIDQDVAAVLQSDPEKFKKTAKEWTQKYAK